jgi:acyl-CoA thioester hydrolase/thioesterase-3
MNSHVHNSKYFDYVLAARYDQMKRCYDMSMEKFGELGFGWVVKVAHIEYKRPLGLGDSMLVRTKIAEIFESGVRVEFDIVKRSNRKVSCSGFFDYTMIELATGRSATISEEIRRKYSV